VANFVGLTITSGVKQITKSTSAETLRAPKTRMRSHRLTIYNQESVHHRENASKALHIC